MVADTEAIKQLIPHREPILLVDSIQSVSDDAITTTKHVAADMPVFQGHYPDYAILPGVYICEAMFQSGALLIAKHSSTDTSTTDNGVPVVARIKNAKFKKEVKPDDTLTMEVTLSEKVGDAWYLKGKALVNDKVVATVDFTCMLKAT